MSTEQERNSRMWGAFSEEEFLRGRSLPTLTVNGMPLERLKFGNTGHFAEEYDCCPDCGARPGDVHIPICEMERCPNCKRQLSSCPCNIDLPGPEWSRFRRDRQLGYECLNGRGATRPDLPQRAVN